jgi:hypothetical protein
MWLGRLHLNEFRFGLGSAPFHPVGMMTHEGIALIVIDFEFGRNMPGRTVLKVIKRVIVASSLDLVQWKVILTPAKRGPCPLVEFFDREWRTVACARRGERRHCDRGKIRKSPHYFQCGSSNDGGVESRSGERGKRLRIFLIDHCQQEVRWIHVLAPLRGELPGSFLYLHSQRTGSSPVAARRMRRARNQGASKR